MTNESITNADLARMVRQIVDSEEKEAVEAQDPRVVFDNCYRVPWRGNEILYCLQLERGVVNITQFYTYSRDMHKKRRADSPTTFQGWEFRVWFSCGRENGQPCPICRFDDWKHTLAISLAECEALVDVSAEARHLMELHRMAAYQEWPAWNNPHDFGYPACCVDAFVEQGYQSNGFTPQDQGILFHWACPGCEGTRCILSDYWRIFKHVRMLRTRAQHAHDIAACTARCFLIRRLS